MSENKIQLSGIFSDGYGFVPKKLMRAKDISNTTKVVLCYLLSYTGAGVSCFPQIKDIAADLGLTTRTIINSINSAIENRYLNKHQENRGGKIGKKNSYELLFMYDFKDNKHVKKNSRAQIACEIKDAACENNDIQHVNEGQSNNNSINNNNNNNKELHAEIIKIFSHANPDYYHDGKQAKAIKILVARFKTIEKISSVIEKLNSIKKYEKQPFWTGCPITPHDVNVRCDQILSYKLPTEMKWL